MHGWETRMLLKYYLERGVSKAALARRFGVSRRTIHEWVETGQLDRDLSSGGARYAPRPAMPHKLAPSTGIIEARLEEFPGLSAKRLFDEVRAAGYPGGYSRVRDYVRAVRPREPVEAVVRFETPAGRQGQVDFATFTLPWGRRHALVVVLSHSRLLWLCFYRRQTMAVLTDGLERAFRAVRRCPDGALVRPDARGRAVGPARGRRRTGVERGVSALCGALGVPPARLPAVKTLAQFDFTFQPSIKREQIESLHELGFLDRAENVILLGPPGVGKTHLAISLAIAAAEAGRRVYYGTLAGLIDSLMDARAAGELSRRLRVLTHPALLVVDEIGYLPVSQDGAVLFFQLINARHERASTVLTSNKGFEEWGHVLGDEIMAAALIDRLLHHCHIVNIRGNSYRMREHQHWLRTASDERREGVTSWPPAPQRRGACWPGLRSLRSLRPAQHARWASTGERPLRPTALSPTCAVFSCQKCAVFGCH